MDPEQLLQRAVEVCHRLGLIYLVTGSTATITYGEPRFTNDIDIVIDLPVGQIDAFCDAFEADEFYLHREAVRDAVRNKSQFNLIHPASGLKIDFILLTDSAFNQSRVNRRRSLPVLGKHNASFASPEDVILMKMVYFREGGSQKHLRDIRGVLRVQGAGVDRQYVSTWAKRLGLNDIWQALLDEDNQADEPTPGP